MKIIAIGDIHGKDTWKKIVEKEIDADRIIFIGDYFDSFDIPFKDQAKNFNEILRYKLKNIEKVILLIGNHDFHYLTVSDTEQYSGFQDEYALNIMDVLENAIDNELMQISFEHDGYLFTHAGVTQTWANEWGVNESGNPSLVMNEMLHSMPQAFKFNPSNPLDNTGDSITQSPIWVRPRALLSDYLRGCTHIVGHTNVKFIECKGYDNSVILIDTMDSSQQYLEINGLNLCKKML